METRTAIENNFSTDSNPTRELARTEWGAFSATRGWWVDRSRIVNTWPRHRFLEWVASHRG